jgi:alpha-beta hydrolase superfamily lysophospholipase
MKEVRFKIDGKLGSTLAVFGIIPEKPKALLMIFHGMGEHKERYHHFATWMADKGYAVFAHDHRKHGQSIGEFEEVGMFNIGDQWEYIIDDANYVVKEAKKRVPNVPVIVLGHSMGSMIARRYISKYTVSPKAAIIMGTLPIYHKAGAFAPSLIASIVGLFNKKNPSPFLAKLLNGPLLKSIDNPVTEFDWLTYNEKNIDAYIKDPLCGYAYTARFYKEFFKGIVFANQTDTISETRNIPILFISGKDDPVGNMGEGVTDVFRLYKGHGFFDLTLELLEDMRHEVLNEKKRMTTYKTILKWMDSKVEEL